jgi:hypothetical protein
MQLTDIALSCILVPVFKHTLCDVLIAYAMYRLY